MHKPIRLQSALAARVVFISGFILLNSKVSAGWSCTTTKFYASLGNVRIVFGLAVILAGYLISLALLSASFINIHRKVAKKHTLKWPIYAPYLCISLSFIFLLTGTIHYYFFAVRRITWQSSDILSVCTNVPTQLSSESAELYSAIIIFIMGSLFVFWSTYFFARALLSKFEIVNE